MKKLNVKVFACLMAGAMLMNSCVGSFSLFNKYADWQRNMTNSKFINAIVGFVLMPIVGSVTIVIDWFILNTIEFWSGENPLASNVGQTKQVMGEDGKLYAVKTLKNGYEVTNPNGEVVLFEHDKKDNSWWMTQNGQKQQIFRFSPDGKSISVNMNGEEKDFTLNEQGVYEARMAAGNGLFFAAR